MKRIILSGITGKTGKAVAQEINSACDFELVAAIGHSSVGQDIGEILTGERKQRFVYPDVESALESCEADVYIDFTTPEATEKNAKFAVESGLDVIIGTTGLSNHFIDELTNLIQAEKRFGILSSNFSLGTVILTQVGQILNHFFGPEQIHIEETHHVSKVDKPSGTALYLQKKIDDSIDIHSFRVHGRISKHELCVNLENESITIAHEVTNSKVFGTGIVYVLRNYPKIEGVFHDLASFVEKVDQTGLKEDFAVHEQAKQIASNIFLQNKK